VSAFSLEGVRAWWTFVCVACVQLQSARVRALFVRVLAYVSADARTHGARAWLSRPPTCAAALGGVVNGNGNLARHREGGEGDSAGEDKVCAL